MMCAAANRISYFFNLVGPSLSVDTACSSSLVATHLGCRSIWDGETEMALVAGVNLILRPETTIACCKASMLSPDGRCKSFDARANGFVRGEIRRLSQYGMKPIWILHTPAKFSTLPEGVGIFHFSRFHESFFTHTSPEGYLLLTYNPQTERFHYFTSLIHVAGKRYIGIHRTLPLSMQVFPFARPKTPSKIEIIAM